MRRFPCALAVLILAWAAGCIVAVEEPGRRVVVEDTHVCVGSCDHLYVDGGWYMVAGHRHGPDCGHYLVKGKWVKQKGDGKPDEKDDPKDKHDKKD